MFLNLNKIGECSATSFYECQIAIQKLCTVLLIFYYNHKFTTLENSMSMHVKSLVVKFFKLTSSTVRTE